MKFFPHFLAIIILSCALDIIAAEENLEQKSWKIQEIQEEIRFPNDIPFFNKENEKLFIEDLEGKALLVVFWATWCAPCIKEMIELDILKKDFRKLPIDIIPISEDFGGIQAVQKFYESHELRHLNIYHDYKNELFRELKAAGLPTCYIVNKDGFIKAIIKGAVNWNEENIRELLLRYIEGNPVMPKNSYRDNSLNKAVKSTKQNLNLKQEEKNDSK